MFTESRNERCVCLSCPGPTIGEGRRPSYATMIHFFFFFLIVNDDLFVVPTVCIIRYLGLNVVVCIVIDDTLDPWNA